MTTAKKRPYRQGQTLWCAWTQLSATGQPEMVAKAMMVVKCEWDVNIDRPHRTGWHTTVRLGGIVDPKGQIRSVEMDLQMFDKAYKTFRRAKRFVDDYNAVQQAHEKALHEAAALGSIQETY